MLVRTASDDRPRPKSLNDMGIASDTDPVVSLSEFIYRSGKEIYGENEPAVYVYQVLKGAVRTYKLLPDGRRQISAFHVMGDIVGLENGEKHRFTAEAVVETRVRLIRRPSLESAASADPLVFRDILGMTTRSLQHAENHLLLLGRKTAIERVAAFLLEMDERLTATGVLSLPMSRRDIADYLGLTIETVSRAISELRRVGVLEFVSPTQRKIVILDRHRLAGFDCETRNPVRA
ncbi:helix-turn-helix domain-containing protein [Bradyrhizobium liaoningense]|uniref:helix-turn-helix domain-containing protein n=1 Tax=Bradyrhizobium liaoningense TaxID=43992 RepID=UPI001BA8BB9A|nr:helix-turn-helix domain-containing protein [Bradyrhizobium liaoningense]MBR0739295.1 helix-turn-helix domain-containing protein [Bradyrhizobium liaoningense]